MKIFRYPFFARLVYHYANIPISLLLIIYLIFSLNAVIYNWVYIFPIIINLLLLSLLNRFYFRVYKKFPAEIQTDHNKLICSSFPFSKKIVHLEYRNITDITGGIFSGTYEKPIYLNDSKNKITIVFSSHINGYNDLLRTILSNINKDVYENALQKFKSVEKALKEKQQL